MLQTLLTVLIVAGSALYVVWTLLLPASLRRAAAQRLLRRRWPKAVEARLLRWAGAPGGCGGCDGCTPSSAPPTSSQEPQPVRWTAPSRKRRY